MKAHNYAEYELRRWCFSRNFWKLLRKPILKENLCKKSAFADATLKLFFIEVNPPQSCPWKQNGTTVMACEQKKKLWETEEACCR